MSRIGKKPIIIPDGTEASITDSLIKVKGPKGELEQKLHPNVKVTKEGRELTVSVSDSENTEDKALWGLFASLIGNMIKGVTEGFEKQLEVNGVGYRVEAQGNKLVLHVGYSHPVEFDMPEGISAKVEKNVITLSGVDKQLVGEMAAQIRKIRKPEPYKGKGIKYVDEQIRRKAGKAAKAAGGE